MTQMPDTLTLAQVEELRRTLPQKSMNDIMPEFMENTIDVDKIIETQVQVIGGQEVFIAKET
jgi:hypothetical protein